jgi:alpha-aminoadipic semialdehyde synthase
MDVQVGAGATRAGTAGAVRTLGIRREDKNVWERRVPIIPEHLQELLAEGGGEGGGEGGREQASEGDPEQGEAQGGGTTRGVDRRQGVAAARLAAVVQPFARRVFSDAAYRAAGARVQEPLSEADVVFAVKEIPAELFEPGQAYAFFAHVIKKQPHNMTMLRRLLELSCTLVDYEKITDDQGRRLVFFSRQAGQAGMIDTLHLLGKRLRYEGLDTPLTAIRMAYEYGDLEATRAAIAPVAERLAHEGLPAAWGPEPLVVGFAGYGNVSQGAQEVFDLLPHVELTPEQLLARQGTSTGNGTSGANGAAAPLVKVVFREEHMVARRDDQGFELSEYYQHPERYQGRFSRYLPHLHVLLNGIYWEERYPRLVRNVDLGALWGAGSDVAGAAGAENGGAGEAGEAVETGAPAAGGAPDEPDATGQGAGAVTGAGGAPRLRVIGDVSCDIEGSIQCTVKTTMPDAPAYVWDPGTGEISAGVEGRGPVIMAVDNLPAELARESSIHFSHALRPFVEPLVRASREVPFDQYDVPAPVRRAVIVYNGELTPDFQYLADAL